jgi:hypothetical protein
MADTLLGRSSLAVAEVDDGTYALRAVIKPLAWGTRGHYRTTHRCVLAAAQAANSRLFEVRNVGTNLIVVTLLNLQAIQTAAGTAQENSLDVYRVTGFTVTDSVNTVTPAASVARTSGMTAAPGGVDLRGVTQSGAAAGMTGGTLTKDGNAISSLPLLVSAAASPTIYSLGVFDGISQAHPLVLAPNEGLIIENRVLNVTSYGFSLYLDFGWAEAPSI